MGVIDKLRNKLSDRGGREDLYIIAGLGNPGNKYDGSRHNVGFEVIDKLSDKYSIALTSKKFRGYVGNGRINNNKVILLKPQTYMNLSGESIRSALDFYKIPASSRLIVIYDDISLDVGQIRVRPKGSAGGHNGLKSIISHLGGSQEFLRVRVGVGAKPEGWDLADYVLSRFIKDDIRTMDEAYQKAADAAAELVGGDVNSVMSRFNAKS